MSIEYAIAAQLLESQRENKLLRQELEELQARIECRVITCVYCGFEYQQGTPTHGASVLTEHIKTCPKHPMKDFQNGMKQIGKILEDNDAKLIDDRNTLLQIKLLHKEIMTNSEQKSL